MQIAVHIGKECNTKRLSIIILLGLLFIGGLAGGYFYFSKVSSKERQVSEEGVETLPEAEDLFPLKIYYPVGNRLQIEEKRLQRKTTQIAIAQAIVKEFLKGPADMRISDMPKDAKLLGLYRGEDRVLYVDLSEEFRGNFQGDALTEFLLLKGLYVSLISNFDDIEDVKVLIEGKEIETLGGHLYLSYPLKDMVSHEYE
ncbi:MAG: GerMN domain-containing protein [Thermodesulfovibrionales bacterium]|nr:GerMN domain-containing protein [Thermodesulfovibrionales bacterium]